MKDVFKKLCVCLAISYAFFGLYLIFCNQEDDTYNHQEYEIHPFIEEGSTPQNLYSLQIDKDYQNISFLINDKTKFKIKTIRVKYNDLIELKKGKEDKIQYDENKKGVSKNVKITYKE